MERLIRWIDDLVDGVLGVALALLLLICVYFICDTVYIYRHASGDQVQEHKPGSSHIREAERPFTDDYVAWLTVDGTTVDYPVMQGDTNTEYLNQDPYGDYSLSGSIFLDSRNAPDFSDSYSLIYGHHMADGLMFGALDAFLDEAYFEDHRTGTLTVGEQVYQLRLFAVVRTDAGEKAFFTPQGSEAVLEAAENGADLYRTPEGERVLALSTCQSAGSTSRIVVLATLDS